MAGPANQSARRGQINPDTLLADPQAVRFVSAFVESGKAVGAIRHGPWLLFEADVLRGRAAASCESIRTDVANAGARWRNEPIVAERGIMTSRKPGGLPAFIAKIVEDVEKGRQERAA